MSYCGQLLCSLIIILAISFLFLSRDVVELLLADDRWKEMMKSSWRGKTLMRNLIDFMPGKEEFTIVVVNVSIGKFLLYLQMK